MSGSTVLLAIRHIVLLARLRRDVADTVRAVRQQLRDLGVDGLAGQLDEPLRQLGQMGDLHRAMDGAARNNLSVDAELVRIAREREQRQRVGRREVA